MANFIRTGIPEIYAGLSTDTKPTTAPVGSRCYETDTGVEYIWNGTAWVAYAPSKYVENITIGGHILFADDNQSDIGTALKGARNIYFETAIFGGAITGDWNPSVTATYDLGKRATNVMWKDGAFSGIVNIGVYDATDTTPLQVRSATAGAGFTATAGTNMLVEGSGNTFLSIGVPDVNYAGIKFGSPSDVDSGGFSYTHSGMAGGTAGFVWTITSTDRLKYQSGAFAFQESTLVSATSSIRFATTVTDQFIGMYGGTTAFGTGALILLTGKTNGSAGIARFYTPNAAGITDVLRLTIPGMADTTGTVAWTNVNAMSFDRDVTMSAASTLVIESTTLALHSTSTALELNSNVNVDIVAFQNVGTGRTFGLHGTSAATGAGNISDSSTLSFYASYRDGANALTIWPYTILHDMITGGATPKSQAIHSINSVAAFAMENNNGTITNYSYGSINLAYGNMIFASVDNSSIYFKGGLFASKAGQIGVFGKDAGTYPGGINFQTPDAGTGDILRLSISGVAATAVATWSNVTHSGFVITAGQVLTIGANQVVGARVVDARCDDSINSGDATTDGVIDSLRDAMIAHGLIAAA